MTPTSQYAGPALARTHPEAAGAMGAPPPQDTHTLGMAGCRPWVLWFGLVAAGAIVQVSCRALEFSELEAAVRDAG